MTGSPVRVPAPELPAGPRSALVVATLTYADPSLRRLRAPATDAAVFAATLADPQVGAFTVTSVIDQRFGDIAQAIEGFLAGRSPDELVVLYLSCHGVKDSRGRLYYAASDTIKDLLAATAV